MTKTVTLQGQQKWEYFELTRKTETYLLDEINGLGQQGWELVAVTHGKDLKGELCWTAFLKRPCAGHASAHHHHQQVTQQSHEHDGQVTIKPPAPEAEEELRFKDE